MKVKIGLLWVGLAIGLSFSSCKIHCAITILDINAPYGWYEIYHDIEVVIQEIKDKFSTAVSAEVARLNDVKSTLADLAIQFGMNAPYSPYGTGGNTLDLYDVPLDAAIAIADLVVEGLGVPIIEVASEYNRLLNELKILRNELETATVP